MLLCFSFALTFYQASAFEQHPFIASGLFIQTEYDYVTIQYHNGALQNEYLLPGLHFTPWKLIGNTYLHKKVRADTDCYDGVRVETKDPQQYEVWVCVTNQVAPEDMVEVINTFGFDYDEATLKAHTSNSMKEVVSKYTWLDMEDKKSNQLNEDIAEQIRAELVEKFGDVGKKIKILSVSIKKKDMMGDMSKVLADKALTNVVTTTNTYRSDLQKAQLETKQKTDKGEMNRTSLQVDAENRKQDLQSQAKTQLNELRNTQVVKNAETAQRIATIQKETEQKIKEKEALLIEQYPAYAKHERAMAYNSALGGSNSKYILTDGFNSEMQGSLLGSAVGWLFGKGKEASESCASKSSK